jgi:hypothetical protein
VSFSNRALRADERFGKIAQQQVARITGLGQPVSLPVLPRSGIVSLG